MRWSSGGRSGNLEDRRGQVFGGLGGKGLGIGGTAILLILSLVFGKDFLGMVGTGTDTAAPVENGAIQTSPEEERLVDFVSFVLDSSQAFWRQAFQREGANYRDARLVLFRDGVESACGVAQSATGPFYCPGDEKVYVDLGFYGELKDRVGAPGDFAQAYVLAHEIGHHVQHLLGYDAQASRGRSNQSSVRLELQADCFAGIWGHRAAQQGILEPGDAEEGLNAAAAIGDDRLQRMAGSRVSPESFTHGSSEQRLTWFRRGLTSGRPDDCDTNAGS
jgi:uncharacterized protein